MNEASSGTAVRVRLPGALREYAHGAALLDVNVGGQPSVRAVLDQIGADHPALDRRLRDERGDLRRHVNVFVGEINVRDSDLLDTVVGAGAEIFIAPAVSGG